MAASNGAAQQDPMRSFTLDLLYPAVLGGMIVLLFMRIANFGLTLVTEPTTLFGILIASYYSIGFVNAKMIAHYNVSLFALDCISSALIFICLYVLGFSHDDQIPTDVHYVLFYFFLIGVMVSPILRRIFRGLKASRDRRTLMALSSTVFVLLALLNALGVDHLSWLTPIHVLTLLSTIFVIYLWDLGHRGVVT
jgi:hypothetical protein